MQPAPVQSATLLGVEIAEGGVRLTVTPHLSQSTRRWHTRLPHPPTPDDAVTALCQLVSRALQESGEVERQTVRSATLTLGVAVWGDVDPVAGLVRGLPPAAGWVGYPLAERLATALTAPVTVVNAAHAGALAEARLGAGQHYAHVLYVHIGRQISAAYAAHGSVLVGSSGRATDLGHVAVRADGPRCSCGVGGHVEALASAQAIVRRMIGLASDSDESLAALLRISGGRAEAATATQVVQLAEQGDPAARTVVSDALDALALALANAFAILDPDAVVIDSPLMETGSVFASLLDAELKRHLPNARAVPPVLPAALTPFGPLLGARILAEKGATALL